MRRMLFAAAVVLCCSSAYAAPPSVHTELAGWWDNWHDAEGYLLVGVLRQVSTNRTWKSDLAAYNDLWAIANDPATSPAAKRQAYFWLNHWGFWRRKTGTVTNVP